MIRVSRTRARFTQDHRRLNRARRLFMWITRHEIEDVITLAMVADAMILHGLYWPGATTEGVSYSIIKRLYDIYFGGIASQRLEHWWGWMERFEWCGKERPVFGRQREIEAGKKYPFEKLPWKR